MWPHDEFSGIHSRGRMMSHIIVQLYEYFAVYVFSYFVELLRYTLMWPGDESFRQTLIWPHDIAHHCAAI